MKLIDRLTLPLRSLIAALTLCLYLNSVVEMQGDFLDGNEEENKD